MVSAPFGTTTKTVIPNLNKFAWNKSVGTKALVCDRDFHGMLITFRAFLVNYIFIFDVL